MHQWAYDPMSTVSRYPNNTKWVRRHEELYRMGVKCRIWSPSTFQIRMTVLGKPFLK